MNILYIFHYAGSPQYGMSFRPYYMAREWVKMGHHVTIVGASYSHLRIKQPMVKNDFDEEVIDGIKYVWLKTPEYGGSIARIKNIGCFVNKLRKNAKKFSDMVKPDLVIASSTYPLDNVPAHKIAKLSKAKLCYEAHDIWPLSPMVIGGYSKYHPFIMVMQWAEDYAYKHCDKVISLLWNAEDHCRERGLAPGKFKCIPNGYLPEEWTDDKFDLPLPEEHQKAFESLKGKTIVGFAGGFAASGSLDTLLKAAAKLKDRDDVHFVLVGKGPEYDNYLKIIKEYQLNNVTILPPVLKKLIPAVNKHFDIAFLGGVHSILHRYGTSANKMTDYMLCSLPIVHAVDEPGSLVEREKFGIRVEAENVEEVAKAISKLADMSDEERKKFGERGRTYATENLQWSFLAKDFIDTFK